MVLHCIEPFIITIPSSLYDLNDVEGDVKKQHKIIINPTSDIVIFYENYEGTGLCHATTVHILTDFFFVNGLSLIIILFSGPKQVVNLTATLEDEVTIHLDWSAPEESIQDHYVVRHRASLRDGNALWVENSTLSTNLTLPDLFPGEKYEIEVYAVKNEVRSEKQSVSQVTGIIMNK